MAKRIIEGSVISDKMDKSIVVQIETRMRHPEFGKVVTKKTKAVAHDEENKAKIGDFVRIEESKPYSKTKKWVLKEIMDTRK